MKATITGSLATSTIVHEQQLYPYATASWLTSNLNKSFDSYPWDINAVLLYENKKPICIVHKNDLLIELLENEKSNFSHLTTKDELQQSSINPYLQKVMEFNSVFGVPELHAPGIPSKEAIDLKIRLIQEELDELKIAAESNDIVGVADALADIQYVTSGAITGFGLQNSFDDIFNEVHSSNMSKICKDEIDANNTVKYWTDMGQPSYKIFERNSWFVKRTADNKIMKSVSYRAADIKGKIAI